MRQQRRESKTRQWCENAALALTCFVCCPVISIYCCYAVATNKSFYCGTGSQQERHQRRMERTRRQWKKNPHRDFVERAKSHKLRRALTLPLPSGLEHGNGEQQATHNQTQSLLFRLPAELRRQIYAEVLDMHRDDHATTRDKNGRTFNINIHGDFHSCALDAGDLHLCTAPLPHGPKPDAMTNFLHQVYQSQAHSPVHLLQTCRRVYSEAIVLMYGPLNTFAFASAASLCRFKDVVPQHRYDGLKNCIVYLTSCEWGTIGRTAVPLGPLRKDEIIDRSPRMRKNNKPPPQENV